MVHTRARGALHLKMRPDFLLKVFKLLKLKKYKNLHIQRAWIIKAPKQRPSAVRFLSIQLVRILRFSSSKIIKKLLRVEHTIEPPTFEGPVQRRPHWRILMKASWLIEFSMSF